MMMPRRLRAQLLYCVLLPAIACGPERDGAPSDELPRSDLLGDVPVFPLSSPSSVAGTSESLEKRYLSGMPADSVASWYHRTLANQGWEIVSDSKMPDGSRTIFAERRGAPLWVMIGPNPNGGTRYSLVAAGPG